MQTRVIALFELGGTCFQKKKTYFSTNRKSWAVENQMVVFKGKLLEDQAVLAEEGVSDLCSVAVMPRIRGGNSATLLTWKPHDAIH